MRPGDGVCPVSGVSGRRSRGGRVDAMRIQSRAPPLPAFAMPSFDIVSEVDKHELMNAVDQANRELSNRFDFKGSDATFSLDGYVITASAPSDFQLKQMQDILR